MTLSRRQMLVQAARVGGGALLGGSAASALAACGEVTPPPRRRLYTSILAAGQHPYSGGPPLSDFARQLDRSGRRTKVSITLQPQASGSRLGEWAELDRHRRDGSPSECGVYVVGYLREGDPEAARYWLNHDTPVIAFLVDLQPRSAAISVDAAAMGQTLATHAADWVKTLPSGRARVLLVRETTLTRGDADDVRPLDWQAARVEQAIRDVLAERTPGAAITTIKGEALAGALRDLRPDVVLCWEDETALAAVAAGTQYVGALGQPGLHKRETLVELERGGPLRAVVSVRPSALADALTGLSHALLVGDPAGDREVDADLLVAGAPAVAEHLREYGRDPRDGRLGAGEAQTLRPGATVSLGEPLR